MNNEQKTFGIDKLNVKRSEIPAVTMLIIQLEYKQFQKKLINVITT